MYDDLITEARELCKYSEKIVNQLHTERLDYELEYMPLIETIQVTSELCDALVAMTARAEKAEAEIKSIHESLNFADKSRSKCANYVELAVSNGLALGKIAVAIQHDYDAEPPEGE